MTKNITLGIVTIALAICTNTNGIAQSIDLIDSKAVIEKGIKLHEDEKYDEAVIEYKKITANDTNYVLASYELIITYMAQKKDSIALLLCDEVLPLRSSYTPGLLATKANLLDNLKRSDEALKTYEEGQKRYPLNYSYYYESGVLKMRQKKYFEAYSWFEKSVKINPYHANTHYQMGLIALKQGKLIPCMLAWQYYLVLDNSSDRAKQLINTLEAMSKNEYDMGEAEQIKEMDNFTDYSELEALVKSKVALSSKYKSETKLKFDLTKQLQLILEKIETSPSDKGFYAEFYAPFYKKIYANKMLDAFTYDILNGLNNEDVNSWMKKNKEKYNAFANFVSNYVIENKTTYEEDLNGQKIKAQHYFNSNYKITSVGNINSENKNIGYWKYYYPNAIVKAEGPYNDTQQKDGVWKYYDNGGAITSLERISNNKYEGGLETYYFNGAKSTTQNYKADALEGEQTKYYSTGAKNTVYNYKNNKENGKRSQYYKNGQLEYEVNIVDGKFEGPCTTYHENGNIKSKSSYVNDNRVGVHTTFYDYPKDAKKEISNYDNGVIKGHYEEYHWNGALAEIGEVSNDGMRTGLWKTYNDKKAITSEINYKNGKLDGSSIYYSNKGVKWDEYIYSNDMLQEYKAYDKDAKVIYSNKKDSKKDYTVKIYYPNGNVKREGFVVDRLMSGKWKSYNYNGVLDVEENFTEGKKDGTFIAYYENGKTRKEYNFVNDEVEGLYKEYYKNGKLKKEGNYKAGKEEGYWKKYYSNGNSEAINFYEAGEVVKKQQYFTVKGKLESEDYIELDNIKYRSSYDSLGNKINFSALDKGTGVLEEKYKNGKISWSATYKNNLKQGVVNNYSPKGQLLSTKNYVNNNLEGVVKNYYVTGTIKSEENFINDIRNGSSKSYYENGVVKRVANYINGSLEGVEIYYYPNGQPQTEYTYYNNTLEGTTKGFAATGDLAIVRNFENGVLISYQYTDKTGELVAPISVKNETGLITAYFKNGVKSLEYTLKAGYIDGKRMQYSVDGKPSEEAVFVDDDRQGLRTFYYPSGKIRITENWLDDELSGITTYYYENGKVKVTENYIADTKFGDEQHYDETGKLKANYTYYNGDLIDEK